ncbi:putative methenyltetrahydrofolate cyclohydrolase, Methylenetetrahydrofolate dehydrogenase (NADP(+)) [Dioscorea sansibarensis]
MRALFCKLAWTPSPMVLRGAFYGKRAAEIGGKDYILGPCLPDLWPSPSSPPPPPPPPSPSPIRDEELTPIIINGESIAKEIRSSIAEEVRQMKQSIDKIPGLAVILVGQRRDSQSYVRCKIKACEEVGISSRVVEFPVDCNDNEIVNAVSSFNEDPSVHGILVQLPLPQHMNEDKILNALSLEKDVDGFHPLNVGNLAMRDREPLFIPCSARACVELLLRSNVKIMGMNTVIIGRSRVVGLPTSLLLQRHHATVSIVHAFTENSEDITREADIVISAAGAPGLVRGSWLKKGAVVIDVGTNAIEDLEVGMGTTSPEMFAT